MNTLARFAQITAVCALSVVGANAATPDAASNLRGIAAVLRTAQPLTLENLQQAESALPKLAGPLEGSLPLRLTVLQNKLSIQLGAPRIVGGTEALPEQARWQVALIANGYPIAAGFFCGGSIVRADWILTAAHCVEKTAENQIRVYSGSRDLTSGGSLMNVAAIEVHPQWNRDTMANDIALVKLSNPIAIESGKRELVNLATSTAAAGSLLTVTGWGKTSEGGAISTRLRQVSVPLIDKAQCNGPNYYDNQVTAGMLCAGVSGLDSCQGDSGGPLVTTLQSATAIQVGIVSWGEGCARPNKPSVYTDVANFNSWIIRTIGM